MAFVAEKPLPVSIRPRDFLGEELLQLVRRRERPAPPPPGMDVYGLCFYQRWISKTDKLRNHKMVAAYIPRHLDASINRYCARLAERHEFGKPPSTHAVVQHAVISLLMREGIIDKRIVSTLPAIDIDLQQSLPLMPPAAPAPAPVETSRSQEVEQLSAALHDANAEVRRLTKYNTVLEVVLTFMVCVFLYMFLSPVFWP